MRSKYVHNPSLELWHAYHRVVKYLMRTKDFDNYAPLLRRTEPYGFTDSDWAADLDNRKSTVAYLEYLFLLDEASCWKVNLRATVCSSIRQA